jgi:hypothetical protein
MSAHPYAIGRVAQEVFERYLGAGLREPGSRTTRDHLCDRTRPELRWFWSDYCGPL